MQLPKPVLIIAGLLLLVVGGWLIYDLITVTDEESAEAFIQRAAKEMSTNEAEDYMPYVDLPQFGFRLEFRNRKQSFTGDEGEAFLKMTRDFIPRVKGSLITIRDIEIEVSGRVATFRLIADWQRKDAQPYYVDRALVRCDGSLVKSDASWKISRLRAEPVRNPLQGL